MKTVGINILLKYLAMLGNIIYFFWILINGIGEGFRANMVQYVSYIGLLLLLSLNTILLYRKKSM